VEHNTYVNKHTFDIWLDKILSYVSYKIVAVSNTVRDFTAHQEGIPLHKFVTIYNGIDIAYIHNYKNERALLLRDRLLLKDKKIFLNVARLTTQKNHRLLVDAFSIFVQQYPDTVLLILGEGALYASLEEYIADMHMTHCIKLLGARSDVYDFYLESCALVSTSIIEGLSIAYLEALAFGVPILATKTAGTDEIIQSGINGYFVEHTTQSVVSGLCTMYKNHQNLIPGAFESSVRFDIKHTVMQYESLIKKSLLLRDNVI
jgi:glycosyltransferase involved in cell wall biosynthesis